MLPVLPDIGHHLIRLKFIKSCLVSSDLRRDPMYYAVEARIVNIE